MQGLGRIFKAHHRHLRDAGVIGSKQHAELDAAIDAEIKREQEGIARANAEYHAERSATCWWVRLLHPFR